VVTVLLALAISQSILVDRSYRIEPLLHELPSAESYGHLLEHLVQPVILSLEESGGFSDVDPAKLSIYGDSWVWTEHYFDGFNNTDPLFPGAAAFTIPFRLLSAFEVVYAENPHTRLRQGIALWSGGAPRAGFTLHFPDAGGTVPAARPLVDAISTSHAENRTPPPPRERRRFGDAYQLSLVDRRELPIGRLTFAIQMEDATRRFLDFEPDGSFHSVFDEGYFDLATAAILEPSNGTRVTLLAEYLERDRLFAELHYAPEETYTLETLGLMLGVAYRRLSVALTLKRYRFEPNELGFTRELFDPDGEALRPFHPSGTYGAAKLDVSLAGELFYLALVNRFLSFAPSTELWSNPVTAGGEPYASWTWRSADTAHFLGDERAGIAERLDLGPVALAYDIHLALAFAANRSRDNTLVFADIGIETSLELDELGSYRPFLSFAKTPIPPSALLVQALDPRYLDGALRLADGRTIERTGGASTRVADGVALTNIYSLATGIHIAIAEGWSFEIQGILKTYRNTYELEREGDRLLFDDVRRDQPFYFGAHLLLLGIDTEEYVVSVGFSAYNAIGHPPPGNGPLANDIGVIDPSSADPIADINRQANLDGDRGFHFKALLGYRFFDRLWTFLSIRHRDGQPFAFLDAREDGGRIALVQATKRGSPLELDRPLEGPREDFHLDFTVKLSLELALEPIALHASLLAANLLDFGNEIQERNGPLRPVGRPALEQQIPRSFLLSLEASY
jgi:hypothetical protein